MMPQEQVSTERVFVGLDVGKARLDVQLLGGEAFSVSNDKAGLKALVFRLRRLQRGGPVAVAVEASGGYERQALGALHRAGISIWRLDAAQVRAFARGLGRKAKTDRLDAEVIARCLKAVIGEARPWEPDPAAERLAALVAFRRRLVAERTALQGQAEHDSDPLITRIIKARLAALKLTIVQIEKAIATAIAADPLLAQRNALLQSAPGVGPVLAATLIADLPELGRRSSRQIAALAGVAPFDRQSGNTTRRGRCHGGRSDVRSALYMGTLAAIRAKKQPLAAFHQRLTSAGKPFKLAIAAAMRKLLATLNAMLQNNTIWTNPNTVA